MIRIPEAKRITIMKMCETDGVRAVVDQSFFLHEDTPEAAAYRKNRLVDYLSDSMSILFSTLPIRLRQEILTTVNYPNDFKLITARCAAQIAVTRGNTKILLNNEELARNIVRQLTQTFGVVMMQIDSNGIVHYASWDDTRIDRAVVIQGITTPKGDFVQCIDTMDSERLQRDETVKLVITTIDDEFQASQILPLSLLFPNSSFMLLCDTGPQGEQNITLNAYD